MPGASKVSNTLGVKNAKLTKQKLQKAADEANKPEEPKTSLDLVMKKLTEQKIAQDWVNFKTMEALLFEQNQVGKVEGSTYQVVTSPPPSGNSFYVPFKKKLGVEWVLDGPKLVPVIKHQHWKWVEAPDGSKKWLCWLVG